jgi:Rv0078B-related antitoxin
MSDVKGDAAARLRLAVDMADFGIDLQRQNLRRRHPDASEREIDELLDQWLLERPGAPEGDCAPPVTRRR